jgi:hypothetical protein
MQEIFEVLESKGLVSETDVPIIDGLGEKELTRLYDQLYHVIFDAQNRRATATGGKSDIDPFTFFAGASLRGDLSCWELPCRIQKLDFLSRYAALYANEVTVPLPLRHPENIDSIDHAKNLLRPAAITLLRLRPLITGGLVKPVVMRSTHCIHTIKWVEQMTTFVHEFADEAAKEWASDFQVVYQLPEKAPAKRSSA